MNHLNEANTRMDANNNLAGSDGRSTRHAARRREVMDDAIQYIFANGLADLSIRPMAEAMGISHRTLLHHFGSKDDMIVKVLSEVRQRELDQLKQRTLDAAQDPLAIMDSAWAYAAKESRLSFWRSFFEIYGIALKNPDRYTDFLDSIVAAWLPMLSSAVTKAGVAETKAMAIATLMQASLRGLILDLLTTGDRKRVQATFLLLREMLRRELEAPELAAGSADHAGSNTRKEDF